MFSDYVTAKTFLLQTFRAYIHTYIHSYIHGNNLCKYAVANMDTLS